MNAKAQQNWPNHVAIIMDGNGRWAKSKGLPRIAGHRSGVKTLRKLIEYSIKVELKALTVYAFSTENWQRPENEVDLLMDLFISALESEIKDLHKNNVKLTFIGDRLAFNQKLQNSINNSESLTRSNSGLRLNVAANYSGRWDILNAFRSIGKDIELSNLTVSDIDEDLISSRLSLADYSDPDLFIRTGGEQRVSNYLLWQAAYTELYFTEVLWPDFDKEEFVKALDWFSNRQRRFGKTSEQIEKNQ